MCGICGKISPEGVTRDEIQAMTGTLSHRGPDDTGIYIGGIGGLGHCRLSIIDLGRGRQPMSNEEGNLWIVFNGEIYNYQELRAGLERTHRFSTDSDTEVILHLFEDKREKCVDELRGMFAFAIWDTGERSLFLARDHLGQKPLFYVHRGDSFAFASEIKALLVANPSLNELDCEALHQYLTLRVIAPPRTMFRSIRKLAPGHTIVFKEGRLKLERYWNLRYEPKLALREADVMEELDHRMRETVRYHMVSDVPVGAFLSGGMDSSLVVALMSTVREQPIKTFSIGVPYQNYSELPFARMVAERYRTEHFEDTIYPSIIKILPELVWHLDEPSDPLSACMYYISQMARREVKVVLGGDGGDELFGGYDRYYGNRYVKHYALLPESFRRSIVSPLLECVPDRFWYKSLTHKLKWLHRLSFLEGGRRYAESLSYFYFTSEFWHQVYGAKLLSQLDGFDPQEAISSCFDAGNASELVEKMMFADSMIRLPDHSVMVLDRTTMAHGLEARSPFMDHKLVEFVARIPSSLKVRGSTRRYVQARIAEKYLPPTIVRRKKLGFSSALPYLLAGEFRQIFTTFLSDCHLGRDGYLREEAIRRLVADHLAGKIDHGNRLWLLCNAELWYRMAIEGWPREKVKEQLSGPEVRRVF
jgi:asparagine synthase (glutamine-hydrolysing)